MKNATSLAIGVILSAPVILTADITLPYTGASISFTSFYKVTGGVFDDLPDTYYAVFSESDMSGATHILVKDLALETSGETILSGQFEAVDSSSEETVASGGIGFKFDSADDIDGTYPIVGVIPLSGGFENSGITSTSTSGELNGKTGSLSYSPDIGAMKITIGSTSSYVSYVESEGSEIDMETPFAIADDSSSVTLAEGFASVQEDGTYTGMIHANLSSGSVSDLYKITITDSNDGDNDGVSDLFDPDNYWYADSSNSGYFEDGDFHSDWFGEFFFYYLPRWTDSMTGYDPAAHGYLWHFDHGYLYGYNSVDTNGDKWVFFYDFNLGWWVTSESVYPMIYAYDVTIDGSSYGGSWLYYIEGTGDSTKRYFYGYSSNLQADSNCGYDGWWKVSGAY